MDAYQFDEQGGSGLVAARESLIDELELDARMDIGHCIEQCNLIPPPPSRPAPTTRLLSPPPPPPPLPTDSSTPSPTLSHAKAPVCLQQS